MLNFNWDNECLCFNLTHGCLKALYTQYLPEFCKKGGTGILLGCESNPRPLQFKSSVLTNEIIYIYSVRTVRDIQLLRELLLSTLHRAIIQYVDYIVNCSVKI